MEADTTVHKNKIYFYLEWNSLHGIDDFCDLDSKKLLAQFLLYYMIFVHKCFTLGEVLLAKFNK